MFSIYKYGVACTAAVLGLSLTSCSDMLDLKPQGQFTTEQMDESSINGLIASAYAGLEAHYFGNNESFAGPSTNWIFDVRSDDAYKGGGGTSMEENINLLEKSVINADNVSCLNKWQNDYYAISRCNNAINACLNVAGTEKTVAELKCLRAWFYFDLIRIFKRIPYITEADNASEKSNMEFSRDEIFAKIKADMVAAAGVLSPEKNGGRINKHVAEAMVAKVCATTGEWGLVEDYATRVIESHQYDLFDNFGDMSQIKNNNGKESIFALQCSTANDNAHINWSNLLNCTYSEGNLYGQGDDFFYGSQNLVNAFRTDAKGLPYLDGTFNDEDVTLDYEGSVDPRLDFTVGRIGMPWRGHTYTLAWCRAYETYGEYSNKKAWPAPEEALDAWPWGCSPLNFIFIRYADILLLKAEALIEQSSGNAHTNEKLVEARNLINKVRTRAANSVQATYRPVDVDPSKADYYVEPYPTGWDEDLQWTTDYARRALRMERRLELALEGHRWFDLVRWGDDYLMKTMNTYMQTEAEKHGRTHYNGCSVSADEIYLPVPQSELDNSHGLYQKY